LDEKKALDVTSVTDEKRKLKKNNLIVWTYHGGPNQNYYIKEEGKDTYLIISNAKGFTVKIPENATENSSMEVGPILGEAKEKWVLNPVGQGCYSIASAVSGKVLDLFNERSSDGTPVIQWKPTGRKNQLWKIIPA
jgi:hypothetical protein